MYRVFKEKKIKRTALFLLSVFLFSGCINSDADTVYPDSSLKEESKTENTTGIQVSKTPENDNSEEISKEEISGAIKRVIRLYAGNGTDSEKKTEEALEELRTISPQDASEWSEILDIWDRVNAADFDDTLNYEELPDGLSESDDLCLVVLGYQLNPDGSMRDELIERLKAAKASAEKYPDAYVLCTGGGTASGNYEATEAGEMKKWLISEGIDESRIIAEDRSMTTAQNAVYSLAVLDRGYPGVTKIAIISSDYHIATGVLLFEAESILNYEEGGEKKFEIVSNAAYDAPSDNLSREFQSQALTELSTFKIRK